MDNSKLNIIVVIILFFSCQKNRKYEQLKLEVVIDLYIKSQIENNGSLNVIKHYD